MTPQRNSRRRPLAQGNDPEDSKRPDTTKKQQLDLKLRCPIYAHAEMCGMEVGPLACNKDQTFPAIDKLNEHLSRVHSLKHICLPCKMKFPPVNEKQLKTLRNGHSCQEKPWPEKGKYVNQCNLMSEEQHRRWAAWTTTNNKRRQPEDGQREKKAFWSWRKIYESLYPNTTKFPAATFAHEQKDPDQATMMDKEKTLDTQPREGEQQATVSNTGIPPKLLTGPKPLKGNDPVWFVSPLSADLVVGQQQCPDTESNVSYFGTSTGPGSIAFSSTSGTTDNPTPPTPSYNSFTDELWADFPFDIDQPQPYTANRNVDILEGNPEGFFRQDDPNSSFSGARDKEGS